MLTINTGHAQDGFAARIQRNEIERLFRRIKAYRRVFTRYDKLDVVYVTFVSMALICEHLR